MNKFKLSSKFLSKYEGTQPNWGFGSLSYFVYKRTYARFKEDGTQEEYFDTIKRVVEGCYQVQLQHCTTNNLRWDAYKAQKSAQKMFQKMWEFKFTPAGRGLWMMGTDIVMNKTSAGLFNCATCSTANIDKDLADPFAWTCDMSMLGIGVGYDTEGAGKVVPITPTGDVEKIVITDDREGWVRSIRQLITSYDGKQSRRPVEFDYSELRPAGSLIKGFGGTASGPEPLREGHENIRKILDARSGQEITSVDIVDIMNYIAKFVIAGNTRRSALLSFGHLDDTDFIEMKDYNKFPNELNDRRWASNNSVDFSDETLTPKVMDGILTNGEPGLINLDRCKHYGRLKDGRQNPGDRYYDGDVVGVNPCAEITLEDKEFCNLAETYPANHESEEEYLDTLKYAFLYCKSVTLLKCHDIDTNAVIMKNRRVGVSQTGVQQAIKKFGIKSFFKMCDEGYTRIRQLDILYSRWLAVPTSIKVTTIKPSGTLSLLSGSTPGVHFTHSEYYFRTVRVAAINEHVSELIRASYKIEVAVTDNYKLKDHLDDDPGTDPISWLDLSEEVRQKVAPFVTLVVYFPVKEHNFTKSKYAVSVWEQLSVVRELQNVWADNAVSVTVTVREEDEKELESAINFFAPYVKTLSFLPLTDHNYDQAPYITATKEEYDSYLASLDTVDFSGTNDEVLGEKYCDADSCTI